MASTFSVYQDDFIEAYEMNQTGDTQADTETKARWATDFTHMFEIIERRIGKLNQLTGETYTLPGSGNKLLTVGQTVTAVSKIEIKTTDAGEWSEISTGDWVYNSKLHKIEAYDTSQPFYYYNVVGGNIRLTVDIGYLAWANFPTKLQGDIINIGRNYYQMLENINSTVPDSVGSPMPNHTNLTILQKAVDYWLPFKWGGFTYVPSS